MTDKDLLQNRIDEYKYILENEYLKGASEKLKSDKNFIDFMFNGVDLKVNYGGFITTTTGQKIYKINNIKDAETTFKTNNYKELLNYIENGIKLLELNSYANQLLTSLDDLYDTIDCLNTDEKGNKILSEKQYKDMEKRINKLNLSEILWLELCIWVQDEIHCESKKYILDDVLSILKQLVKLNKRR